MDFKTFEQSAGAADSVITVFPIGKVGFALQVEDSQGHQGVLESYRGQTRIFRTLNAAHAQLERFGVAEAKLRIRPQ